jgi:uncharacterized protein with PQ loop repeat
MLPEINFPLIVGTLTVIVGLVVKLLGFPDQFLKNYKRKSTDGLSSIFIILAFVSYILWTLHGFFQQDLVLILGQGVGVLTTGAIVYQIFIYRKKE